MTVAVKVDSDSGKGVVFVRQTVVATDTTTSDEISVTVAQVPTTLSVKANASSIDAKGANATPAEAGTTYLDIRLMDENNKGIASKEHHGRLDSCPAVDRCEPAGLAHDHGWHADRGPRLSARSPARRSPAR